jgi:hemerythrin-like domain-containing protein
MLPIGPLMIEHRLIERMIGEMEARVERASNENEIDPTFIDTAADFIRTYADRTHHGKEEDILFRDLEKKSMSEEDSRVMGELIGEHRRGRKMVGELLSANDRYREGEREALKKIVETLRALIEFYPGHIKKEDEIFFPASMEYLDREEKDAMLSEMQEFDRKMIHEKYKSIVDELEGE